MKLRLVVALFVLASNGCALTRLAGYRIAPDFPGDQNEKLRDPALAAEVSIIFDAYGVPHIDAQNESDLLYATGFVHARQRLFQMDMLRRLTRGRISELLGEQKLLGGTTVDLDRTMRGWRLEALAIDAASKLPADERARLQRYADGVNAGAKLFLPIEHRLVGATMDEWRVEDSITIGLLNAWSVSHNWQQEATRLLLAINLGARRSEQIYNSEPLTGGKTLPPTITAHALPVSIPPELLPLFPDRVPANASLSTSRVQRHPIDILRTSPGPVEGASNAWVVSSDRSKSGKPLLASDPHLSHFVPSMLFQQHQRAGDLDVIGATIPGLPYVLMGHNQRVAWGATSTVADAIDLVIEKRAADGTSVEHEGSRCELTSEEATIRVKDQPDRKVTLRRTCNGPLLNDIRPDLFHAEPLVAVRWHNSGLESATAALRTMNRAKQTTDIRDAIANLASPISTWSVADVDGHIGVFVSGTVPIRKAHRGTFPVPGWLAKYEWSGAATPAQMPSGMDPESGLLAHANNLMIEPGSTDQPIVHVDAAPSFRYDRIVERIKETQKHDLDSFAAIQNDVSSGRARALLASMVTDIKSDSDAYKTLKAWNAQGTTNSAAAAIFFSTYRHAIMLALADELEPKPAGFFLSQRYSTNVADGWFLEPNHVVWDDQRIDGTDDRASVLNEAFSRAVTDLTNAQGSDVRKWRWGKLHYHQPKHLFGGSALLSSFNLEKSELPGELDSVWKTHFDPGDAEAPFKVVAGPVYRQVVDLADMKHARWISDTGSSGWPRSPHYGDQYLKWKAGELVPMVSDWSELKSAQLQTLTMAP